jgi:NAD(P)-dependent dehydrogenase (short-subunit alcohol dehydrogenase family)
MDWAGRKVLVTGGSKGIGRAFAVHVAARGARVALSARGADALAQARGALPGGPHCALPFDVRDPAAVESGVASAIEQLGGLDVLVCNAGQARPGYAHALTAEDYRAQFELNALGHIQTVLAALPHFRAQGRGNVVLVASMLGFMGMYGYSAYCASKFALAGFAQALRQELGTVGVTVHLAYPPTTTTPGLDEENRTKPADVWQLESDNSFSRTYAPEAVAASLARGIERGRFEILVGPDSAFIHAMNRLLPRTTRWLADRELAAARAKVGA